MLCKPEPVFLALRDRLEHVPISFTKMIFGPAQNLLRYWCKILFRASLLLLLGVSAKNRVHSPGLFEFCVAKFKQVLRQTFKMSEV